jgi:hypothetical protein
MSFMQRQVEHGLWYVVESVCGTDYVPADVVSLPHIEKEHSPYSQESFVSNYTSQLQEGHTETEYEMAETKGENQWAEVTDALRDYVECRPGKIDTVELIEGFGARLSAPGYMDCTEWCVFETEEEATTYLVEMYGDDECED